MTPGTGNTAPMFSVVVPTFDRPQLLLEAVESVLDQSVADLECIVVCDGGGRIGRLPEDERVRILTRSDNGGPSATRNDGIAAARGTWIAFLDDDDVWSPERLAHAAEATDHALISVCAARFLGSERAGHTRPLEGDVSRTILHHLTPNVGQTIVHREIVPLFRPDLRAVEDIEWWMRLATLAEVASIVSPDLLYRLHSGPRRGNAVDARITERLRLIDEHPEYFCTNRRAEAFQLRRIALMAQATGSKDIARRSMLRSLRRHPSPAGLVSAIRVLLGRVSSTPDR